MLGRKKADQDHVAEQRQLKNVQDRLSRVEGRLLFVEKQIQVIRREQ